MIISEKVKTNYNRTIVVNEEIQNGLLKNILVNSDYSLFNGEKIEELVLPEQDSNKNHINGIKSNFFTNLNIKIKKVIIPGGYSVIQKSAFKDSHIESIVWTKNIYEIPDECFSGSTLKEIININHITKIGAKAFERCGNLLNFEVPDSVSFVGDKAFFFSAIEYIKWSLSSKVFPKFCFASSDLKSITNIQSVECVEPGAFLNCTDLTSIELSDNVCYIGKNAFFGAGIKSFKWPSHCLKIPSHCFDSSCLKEIFNLDSCIEIGDSAFLGTSIVEFTWPKRVQSVKEYTFAGCHNLTSLKGIEQIKKVEKSAFSGCGFKEFTWPSKCRIIPAECFYFNQNLCLIKNIENVVKVNDLAFANCISFKKFVWPQNCNKIPKKCFYGCKQLHNFLLPSLVKTIQIEEDSLKDTLIKSLDLSQYITIKVDDSSIENIKYPYFY